MDRHVASSEMSIGETLILMGRYAEAEPSLKHALSLFKKLDEKTGIVITNMNPKMVKSAKEIIHDLETHTKQNIWNEFDKIFKNIHSEFYVRLFETCPDLTSTEIKTAALLKLNLTTKEIASITFKSEGGIKTTRYRLRKKLGLSGDDKLVPFLMQI